MSTVVAIIPAHNEEDTIEQTLHSLLVQTKPLDQIIVAADNCTDGTVRVAAKNVSVFETKDNTAFKSGALNQALRRLPEGTDYVLIVDADTKIATDVVEEAVILLEANPKLGAVCARVHVMPMEDLGIFERIWLQLQKLEYATADSHRIERLGEIHTLAGCCVIYRMEALHQVSAMRGNDQFYDETALIEDYEITITLKELGWKVTLGNKIHCWTVVPTSMKVHWQQRVRWTRSHTDTLWKKGWSKVTRRDILEHAGFILVLAQQVFFLGLLIYLLLTGLIVRWNMLLWPLLGLFWLDRMYRIKYVQDLSIGDILFRVAYIPEEVYGLLYIVQRICGYWLVFTHAPEKWCIT